MSNFVYKVITKILAQRLGLVVSKLVSEEQCGFMKGRNIHEQIALASEMMHEVKIKRYGGNLALKLDITQVFDTLNWQFLWSIMEKFGFGSKWM